MRTGAAVERQRHQHAALGGRLHNLCTRIAAEARERCCGKLMAPQRHLTERAALGLEHQHELGHSERAAAHDRFAFMTGWSDGAALVRR